MNVQKDLFNNVVKKEWEKEWYEMPEYDQEDKQPFQRIVINLFSKEDVDAFSKLIDQNISSKTNSLVFPERATNLVKFMYGDKKDES